MTIDPADCLDLYVEYRETPSPWYEDFEPWFMGPAGWYVCIGRESLEGPHETREAANAAAAEMRRLSEPA